MKQRRFAVSTMAIKVQGTYYIAYHNAHVVWAVSEHEAVGKGYECIRREKSKENGWSNYDVVVLPVSEQESTNVDCV